MQKSTVSKNALVVDKRNDRYNDTYPMTREELMKVNVNSVSYKKNIYFNYEVKKIKYSNF